ncbi:hypothetical protein EJB05_43458, partial [Eragrostis curvula]
MPVGVGSSGVGRTEEVIGGGAGAEALLEVAGMEKPPPEGSPELGVEGKGSVPAARVLAMIAEGAEKEGGAESEEEEGVKWLKHYSSMQSVLLVGDGDFSFSLALATAFGSGANLVATSLDTYGSLFSSHLLLWPRDGVICCPFARCTVYFPESTIPLERDTLRLKYSKAESNVKKLTELGATVLHGVDAERMKFHTDLKNRRFDRIVFNFPHAGFKGSEGQMRMIKLHKELVRGFFRNARHLLRRYGEIHVSHKTGPPYDKWELEHLASESSLVMIEKLGFQKEDYPGYNHKKGDGVRCDRSFKLGPCCTFKFQIGDLKKQKILNGNRAGSTISSIGGTETHPDKLRTSPVRAVHVPIALDPNQMRQSDLPLNSDATVRAPCFHQQGTVRPSFGIPGSSLDALPSACWCQDRAQYSLFDPEYQYRKSLQREYEIQRQVAIPGGATGSSYSAFLEHRIRESIQKQELLLSLIEMCSGQ